MVQQIRRAGAVCALLSLLVAPAWADEDPYGAAVRGVNGFALHAARLFGDGDFFFSPYSVLSALGMTYAGARDATAREMESALLLSPEFHGALGALTRDLTTALNGQGGAALLTSANRVWLRSGLGLRPDFAETLCRDYGSAAGEVDFKGDPAGATQTINAWVSEHTHGRVQDLLRSVEPDTQMILTNAIYFMGEWEEPFDAKRTSPAPFHVSAGETKDVPMMRQNEDLSYGEAGGVKLLRLPYRGRLSMLLVLPEEGKIEGLLDALAGPDGPDTLARWRASMSRHRVDLWLPKFKAERRYELKDLLGALGLRLAFSNRADFSGMTEDERLKIDAVIHQTFIEVDERKTEASAATGVVMMRATALPVSLPRAEFHADRPFLYLILDNPTGAILFMGRQGFK